MREGPSRNEMFGRITDLDVLPLEYYKLVGDFNRLIQQELAENLIQNEGKIGNAVTLITPGSDARLEKGSFMSPLEVIALVDEDIDLEAYKKTLTEVLDNVSPTRIAQVIEMKGSQSPLVTAYNKAYQPGRIADGRLVYGTQAAVTVSKVKLGREIISLHNDQVDRIASLKRSARKVVEKGKNSIAGVDAVHFDLTSGAVFYNPEAYQIGPLRLVQNTLLIEEVKHTRRESDSNFISTLDSNIVGRLNQLADDRMINHTKASVHEIAEHYAFFLRLYHRSEKVYEQSKQTVLQLTPSENEEVAKRLKALNILMESFKIVK